VTEPKTPPDASERQLPERVRQYHGLDEPDASEREHCERVAEVLWVKARSQDEIFAGVLHERAAAFKDGDKAGYERGRAEFEPLPAVATDTRTLAELCALQSKYDADVKSSYARGLAKGYACGKEDAGYLNGSLTELQSKYETLAAAARAVWEMADRYGSNDTSIDLFDLQTTINRLRDAALSSAAAKPESEDKS
jgi:hypothetical protein